MDDPSTSVEGNDVISVATLLSHEPIQHPMGNGDSDRVGLVQFTSGSSGSACGVALTLGAIEENIAAIHDWLSMTTADVTVSWLPLHHDMGLIGCLLAPVVNQSDVRLLRPEQFVRRPLRYLQCFSDFGGSVSAMPTFGLDYVARRVPASAIDGYEFESWRALIVGSERVDIAPLERFAALVGPRGFATTALLPAYGLAEATLAVTGQRIGMRHATAQVEHTSLRIGEPVQLTSSDTGVQLVGCGGPIRGVTVAIVDEEGSELPDGHLGEIIVRSPSLAQADVAGSATRWRGIAVAAVRRRARHR